MCWILVISCIALLVFGVWASADVGSNIYLKAVCKVKTDRKVAALTFDDAPDEVMTPRVLDVLGKYGVKTTFFVIGRKAEMHREIVERMVREGHTVGNHTYGHTSSFPFYRPRKALEEIEKCSRAIEEITGEETVWFRPPFGVTNPNVGAAVRRSGLRTIGWSIRSWDTVKRIERKRICDRIVGRLHPGAVVLMHDRCEGADEMVEKVIVAAMKAGYKFVTIEELLNQEYDED